MSRNAISRHLITISQEDFVKCSPTLQYYFYTISTAKITHFKMKFHPFPPHETSSRFLLLLISTRRSRFQPLFFCFPACFGALKGLKWPFPWSFLLYSASFAPSSDSDSVLDLSNSQFHQLLFTYGSWPQLYKPTLPATYTPSCGRPPDLLILSSLHLGFSLLETVPNPACNLVGFSFQDNKANPAWYYITASHPTSDPSSLFRGFVPYDSSAAFQDYNDPF